MPEGGPGGSCRFTMFRDHGTRREARAQSRALVRPPLQPGAGPAVIPCAVRSRSQPGVVLDVLLEFGDYLRSQGSARLCDSAQYVRRRSEFLAAIEHDPLEQQLDRK